MAQTFNLEDLIPPLAYGERKIGVKAKAEGYTDSEIAYVTYRSAPRIVFNPPNLKVYNLRDNIEQIEVLYDGKVAKTVPYSAESASKPFVIDLSDTEYPHDVTYQITVKALETESNEETAFENGFAFYGVKRLAYSEAQDGTKTYNESPEWERTGLSIGKVAFANKLASTGSFTPAQDDFAMGYHGGTLPVFKDIYIADINHTNRTEYKKLGESGFTWTSSSYDVMTCFPDMYLSRFIEQVVGEDGSTEYYEHVRVSDKQFARAFKVNKFRMATFHSYVSGSQHYSRASVSPTRNTTIASYRASARNMNGSSNTTTKASVCDWHIFVIRALYLIKYANYNSQATVGQGGNSYNSNNNASNSYSTLLGRDGYVGTDGSTSVWCLGICDLWKCLYEFIDGFGFTSGYGTVYCTDPDKYVDNATDATDGYIKLNYERWHSGSCPNYLDADSSVEDERMLLGLASTSAQNISSSYDKGVCDLVTSANGTYLLRSGGYSGLGANAGLFYSNDNSWSYAASYFGVRLLEIYL